MKTYALATLGCKVNQYESEMVARQLSRLKNVSFSDAADVYIINTCGVTTEAESKARQLISRARRTSGSAVIVLTGCWAAADTERWRSLGVDAFVANSDKHRLTALLDIELNIPPSTPKAGQAAETAASADEVATVRGRRTRSFIKVQDGCDESCAYCAIPTFRGELQSRPIEDIVAELNGLAPAHEVVITGIHLGKYGVDISGRPRLTELLRSILSETGIRRIRVSSIEPQEISDELIELVATENRVARHLHIPLQSGSDRILTAMNRRYGADTFLNLVERVRGRVPDLGLTTDIIVGFPGEEAGDFQATRDLVKQARFSRLHVFKFSARPGTPAASLKDRVEPKVVKARAADLKELGGRQAANFAAEFIDRRVSVLVESAGATHSTGLTSQYVRVKWGQPVGKSGEIVDMTGVRTVDDVLYVALPDV